MKRFPGVRRLCLELTAAVAFAAAAMALGQVHANEPATDCVQGLPALQIELVSAHDETFCRTETRATP